MITAFVRTIILYFLIVVGMRLMGKRQIGELEPSELVLTMMISDLAAVPMQDFGIPLLSGLLPILTLLALSLLLSQLSLRSLRLRALICGTPTVLIRGGKLQQDAMRKNRFTIDELMEELREQGVTRIEDVKYAVLENSGQLTVFPWTAQQPPTAEQLGLGLEDDVTLPMVIINDGRVIHRNLTACGRDENWLRKQLSREKASSPREIFLLTLDEQGILRPKGARVMRAYGISVGILAAILVFSLWNSSYMTASTVRWREQLQQADAQAQSEAWTEAVDTLAGSYDDWSESQTYLHIVARHDTVDDAEAMYRRALAFAATRELTEFRAEISDLRDQLRLLAETERLDIKNVL